MRIEVGFTGAKGVTATIGEHVVHTDQPVKEGGEGKHPSPFDLFLASIAACAGYYARAFCQKRNLDETGLGVVMECEFDKTAKRILDVDVILTLPDGFPDKYRDAVQKAVDACFVKKHIVEPLRIHTRLAD